MIVTEVRYQLWLAMEEHHGHPSEVEPCVSYFDLCSYGLGHKGEFFTDKQIRNALCYLKRTGEAVSTRTGWKFTQGGYDRCELNDKFTHDG